MRYQQWLATAAVAPCLAAGAAQATAPTVASFTPASGSINTALTITGTALTGATSVKIGGVAAKFSVASATQIKATVPATATGTIAVTTPGGSATSTAKFTVVPGATVAPVSADPGQTVTVTGAGFSTYSAIDVYFDTTDVALAVSNGLGVVSAKITVPAGAASGAHWITFAQRITDTAAQASFTVNTNWLQGGFGPQGRGFNPYENTLSNANVPRLDAAWITQDSVYGNVAPLVEYNGVAFNGEVEGKVNAYSSTGTILWTAETGAWLTPFNPVVAGADVVFASGTELFAYKVNCGSKGATCAPAWTSTPPVTITAGLTYFNGTIYAGGSDGQIYPVNPANGAFGTPFYALDNTHGSVSTPVQFAADGSFFYATPTTFQGRYAYGAAFTTTTTGFGFSTGAVSGQQAYFSDSTGLLQTSSFSWQVNLPGAAGCIVTPAVAYGHVYAGSCNSIGAYLAGTGATVWSDTTPGQVLGITVANGVVYACVGYSIFAYDANYGGLLWSGGRCGSAPLVANGTLYAFEGEVSAYTINGATPPAARVANRRPTPSRLHRNLDLVAQRTPDTPAAP